MNIRLTGLLIPAVLVGCASQTPPEESAALVYLDGLIARSAETISVAQLTLNQTGPQPQRPASPIAVPSSTQKVVSPPSQSASVASAWQKGGFEHIMISFPEKQSQALT